MINIKDAIEHNGMLAKFDGIEEVIYDHHCNYRVPNYYPFCDMNDQENTGYIDTDVKSLEYHERWDWLMKIVKKIRSLSFELNGPAQNITQIKKGFQVYLTEMNRAILNADLDKAYIYLTRYVKLYEQTKHLHA